MLIKDSMGSSSNKPLANHVPCPSHTYSVQLAELSAVLLAFQLLSKEPINLSCDSMYGVQTLAALPLSSFTPTRLPLDQTLFVL